MQDLTPEAPVEERLAQTALRLSGAKVERIEEGIRDALDVLSGWTGVKHTDREKVEGAVRILNTTLEGPEGPSDEEVEVLLAVARLQDTSSHGGQGLTQRPGRRARHAPILPR